MCVCFFFFFFFFFFWCYDGVVVVDGDTVYGGVRCVSHVVVTCECVYVTYYVNNADTYGVAHGEVVGAYVDVGVGVLLFILLSRVLVVVVVMVLS